MMDNVFVLTLFLFDVVIINIHILTSILIEEHLNQLRTMYNIYQQTMDYAVVE